MKLTTNPVNIISKKYLIVGRILAVSLSIATPDQFRRFWATFEPLPSELTNEKSLWRTNADLFYTLEFRGDWHESRIETSIRNVAEHSHFFSYFKLVPSILTDIAPDDLHDRAVRFAEFAKQADAPASYPVEHNVVLFECAVLASIAGGIPYP